MKYRIMQYAEDRYMVQKKIFFFFWKDMDSRDFGYWTDIKDAREYVELKQFKEIVVS